MEKWDKSLFGQLGARAGERSDPDKMFWQHKNAFMALEFVI